MLKTVQEYKQCKGNLWQKMVRIDTSEFRNAASAFLSKH